MNQKAMRRIAVANLKAGILDSNLKINHNIKQLTKDPTQQKKLHSIAYHMRNNYEPTASNSVYMLSNQKIHNDTKKAGKQIENLVQPVKSHKTDFGFVSTFDFKSISHLGDIGRIQGAMYNRIADTQLLKKVDQLSPDYIKQISMVTKSNANTTYGSHRYENLLNKIDPKVAQRYRNKMLKQQHKIQKQNEIADHQAEIKNKQRMHHEFHKLHQLEHGNLDKPTQDVVTQKLNEDTKNGINGVYGAVENTTRFIGSGFDFPHNKNIPSWIKAVKNINDADFYNKQLPYIKHAYRMARKYDELPKQAYLHQYHSYSSNYDNIHATADNWLRFNKLSDRAKPKHERELHSKQSFSNRVKSLRKKNQARPISLSNNSMTSHYSKQQIMQYRRSRGIQR